MKTVLSVDRGVTSSAESNDCTVRALANAADIAYNVAHRVLKKHGRKDRKGATFKTLHAAYEECGFRLTKVCGDGKRARFAIRTVDNIPWAEGITFGRLLEQLPSSGEYIINVTGHAVAVVNGKVIDTFNNNARKRVVAVYKRINFGE
jgi:uncharacterized protein (DUF3084 family)